MNKYTAAFKSRLAELVKSRKTETVIMLMVAGYLAFLGFFFGDSSNSNYELIFNFANKYFWSALFFVYATVKAVSLFVSTDWRIKVANGIVGLWAWTYIFLSFTFFDRSQIAPTELLLVMPVFVQAWLTLSAVYWGNKK